MIADLEGGCRCAQVRYRVTELPSDAGWCHCRTCQLTSGAPAMAFATVHIAHWHLMSGEDSYVELPSSEFGCRGSCRQCGTPLTMRADFQPSTIDFTLATLDRPAEIAPAFHIFWRSRLPWFDQSDDLPRFEAFRPSTRGLDGTSPPAGD